MELLPTPPRPLHGPQEDAILTWGLQCTQVCHRSPLATPVQSACSR